MAPRAYWKGYLKLSLVSCPIALFPATSEREKISFHQLNKETGNRIRYKKVDADTGDEVANTDIIKGYELAKGEYIELEPEELEAVAIESKHVIDIEEFVPRNEIDELYVRDPYYIVPDGEVGQQAFAVIREAIRQEGMVALGKVVFTSREHIIALEARGKGMVGLTLRYPYEVRKEDEYFEFRRGREDPEGHARSGDPYRRDQDRALQAGGIQGPIRRRAQGSAAQEAEGREDRAAEGARAVERHQPDGRAQAKHQGRRRRRGRRYATHARRLERPRGEGRRQESGALVRAQSRAA